MNRSAVRFEFQEVSHDFSTSFVELSFTEFSEVLHPDFTHSKLNLVEVIIFHDIGKVVNINFGISFSSFGFFFEELSEVFSNREIAKNRLIKLSIVITVNCLHVLELFEHTKRISQTQQFLDRHVILDTLNHVDDIINLISLEHLS